jgi:hypothetical protein
VMARLHQERVEMQFPSFVSHRKCPVLRVATKADMLRGY